MPLASLQDRLQHIYEVDPGHRVEDFLITDRQLVDRLDTSSNARTTKEKLLIWQRGEELRMSLFLDAAVVNDLLQSCTSPSAGQLSSYCVAVEGVSHFLFMAWNARHGRTVTALEMELQAEVDKFVTVMQRWARCSERQNALRNWLFENVTYDTALTGKERDRYQDANSYARKYCRWLQYEYLHQHRHQAFYNELRRFYRLGRTDKLRHIDRSS